MQSSEINIVAVCAAALSCIILRIVWYSRSLWGAAWLRESRVESRKATRNQLMTTYGSSLALAVMIAATFSRFLPPYADLLYGLTAGALAGVGWVGTALGITYLHERRSSRLFLIDAGFHAVAFAVMGGILAAWR